MTTTTEGFRFPAGATALAFLAVLVVGCSANPPIAEGPAASAEPPLEVWVSHPGSLPGPWATFHVNKPAYVAMFDIRPGVGVTALYPYDHRLSAQRRFHRGLNTVLRRGVTPATRAPYNSCLGAMHSPVVFRVVVASERPLQLARVRHVVSFNFRPALRSVHFAGGTAFSTMDELLYRVLPFGAGPDPAHGVEWALDYVPYWLDASCAPRAPILAFCPVQQLASGIDRSRARGAPTTPGDAKPPVIADGPDMPVRLRGSGVHPPIVADGDAGALARPPDSREADVTTGAWSPEARRAPYLLDGKAGTADESAGRTVSAPELVPHRGSAGGIEDAREGRRTRVGSRSTDRPWYLPNARIPDRGFQHERRMTERKPEVRFRSPALRAAPQSSSPRARPAPVQRSTPKVRPAPRSRPSSGKASKSKDAQK